MRKIYFGILGILTCTTLSLSADAFYENDDALLADKDFPFPPDESEFPENIPSEENSTSSTPRSQSPGSKQAEIKKSNRTKASKDVFPPNPD